MRATTNHEQADLITVFLILSKVLKRLSETSIVRVCTTVLCKKAPPILLRCDTFSRPTAKPLDVLGKRP
jgi:hypothetical protein